MQVAMLRAWDRVLVQQPCSNPDEYPEKWGKVSSSKYAHLQQFCKLQKSPANYGAAFARRRSGVRIPSAPLRKYRDLQIKLMAVLMWHNSSRERIARPESAAPEPAKPPASPR